MTITFTEKQKQALALIADRDMQQIMLYGGSRSGKTFLLCWALHQRALQFPGSRHAILRWRFNHVKQSVWYDTFAKVVKLSSSSEAVGPIKPRSSSEAVGQSKPRSSSEAVGQIKKNKSDWFWAYPNGSEVWFGGLDDEDRVDKILGNEYATIYLNECSQISDHARDTALTRLAQNVPGLDLKVFYDCNPSSTQHWSYRDFVGDPKPGHACLQMNPQDNAAHLPAHYIGLLQNLPVRQRERFLHGRFMAEIEGALWHQEWIDAARLSPLAPLPPTCRIVVGVDPSVSGAGDETGIVVCAHDGTQAYVLEDASLRGTPDAWARRVVQAVQHWHADAVVAEVNQGGDMVASLLRHHDANLRVLNVRASKGKLVRAEPISALYEQGRVHHRGTFALLEEQLTQYTGSVNALLASSAASPDRLDALVWALTDLFAVDTGGEGLDAGGLVLPSVTGGSFF